MSTAPVVTVRNRTAPLGTLAHPEDLEVGSEARMAVRLLAGPVVLVPVDLMVQEDDGNFFLDLTAEEVADLETAQGSTRADRAVESTEAEAGAGAGAGAEVVIPVVAEVVEVEKRRVESGRVSIRKTVATADQVVTDSLLQEHVDVERVPINRIIEGPVGNRQEGDTTVVPVLKEVLVVEKRLMLVEEVRITRRRTEQPFTQTVPVRTEAVVVDREDLTDASAVLGPTK